MAYRANKYPCDCYLAVYNHAWLSTEHLSLVYRLSRKIANLFTGPYQVVEQINPANSKLEFPLSWCMHPVFHCS